MSTPFLVTKSPKSIGIAILLSFLFGPIGLFYASVSGGLIMTITPIILILLLYAGVWQESSLLMAWTSGLIIIFILTYWLIILIWAVISVRNYNEELEVDAKRQLELLNSLHEKEQNQFVININQKPLDTNTSGQGTIVSAKPSIHDWLKNNPRKTINDYFSIFGR